MMLNGLLANPLNGQPLTVDGSGKLQGIDQTLFRAEMINDIPVILPKLSAADGDFDYVDHYEKDAEYFNYFEEYTCDLTNSEVKRLHQKIQQEIPSDARTILDIGCGNGWVSRHNVSDSVTVISVDIALKNVAKALQQTPHKNHFGLVADAFNMPVKPASLDCIIASEIIEHVKEPKRFVQKLLALLRLGGTLIITTPYNETLVYHQCIHCNQLTPENAHLHSFNEQNIKQMIPATISSWNFQKFSNKYMTRAGVYHRLKSLSLPVWSKVDDFANKLVKKPTRLMIKIVK